MEILQEQTDKKRVIFECAMGLICEFGFHGASMNLLARRSGVATGTIYHYFESKEALICALYDYNRNQILSIVGEELSREGSFKERFTFLWRGLYDHYSKNRNVLQFFEQFVNSPYNISKCPQRMFTGLRNFCLEGIRDGELKEVRVEILVTTLITSVISAAKLHIHSEMPLFERDLEHFMEMVWSGIKKQ